MLFRLSLLVLLLTTYFAPTVVGQEKENPNANSNIQELPTIDQEAFDVIYTKKEAGEDKIKVAPLPFPDRRVPTDQAGKKMIVVWLEQPDKKFEISWDDIERIELYEQIIMREIDEMVAGKDYAGAFRYIGFLYRNYPNTPDLDTMRKRLLLENGAYLFSQKQYEAALVVMESLYRGDPNYEASKVSTAISRLADFIISDKMEKKDLPRAQRWIKRFETEFPQLDLSGVKKWKDELSSMAKAKMDECLALKEQKKYRAAKDAAMEVLATWPEIEGINELIAELDQIYPSVRIGVMQKAIRYEPSSLINWSGRRAGSLLIRSLFELRKIGPEGGSYGLPLGKFNQSSDRRSLEITLNGIDGKEVREWDAYWVAQWVASRANPEASNYLPSWAAIFRDAVVTSPGSLEVRLQNPHVLPQALMQWPFPPELFEVLSEEERLKVQTTYAPGPVDERTNAYIFRDTGKRTDKQPVEITEVYYSNPIDARNDLLRGEIDAIDQIFPADANALASKEGIRINTYALPTVYSLLIRPTDHAYLKKLEFRRALLYAVDREKLLYEEILGGANKADGRLVSGPFPVGVSGNDPLGYAYDFSIQPYEYQPRLAKLLVTLTQKQLEEAAKKAEKPVEPLKPIRLGVPSLELMTVAGGAMVQQWQAVGIPAELVVLPPGEVLDDGKTCDLVMVASAVWEPITDADRLLGEGGPAGVEDPFIVQGLKSLRQALKWDEVTARTQEIHRLVHYHLPILPLWQITDRFAVRNTIQGVTPNPVTLYQDIQRWRLK
ncbi:MAG: hypothetical protein JNK90_01015 [Planctomycetaceae bacterium]|nr:hypothetical protein [Planctomycetaceae bacterium]